MRIFSIIILSFLSLIIVFLGSYLFVMRFFFHKLFGRKKTEKRLDEKSKFLEQYKIDICWWKEKKFETLTIVSFDGQKLVGHYLKSESDKLAILIHGYGCDYREMSSYAKLFCDMGYSVFVPENRGHGKSEGFNSLGYFERKDIISWVNVFTDKNPNVKIVLFGLSMGASAVCFGTGEHLKENVKCAVLDSAFENVYRQIEHVYNPQNKKIKTRLLNEFAKYMLRACDYDLKKADCGNAIKNSKIPIMIIHGNEDKYVPVQNAKDLYEKMPSFRRSLYLVEGADHAMCFSANPRKYEFNLREFLKKWSM